MAFVYGCWCVCLSVCTLSLTHSSAGECNKCFVCPYCLFCSFDWPAEKWAAEGRRLLLERERERAASSEQEFVLPASEPIRRAWRARACCLASSGWPRGARVTQNTKERNLQFSKRDERSAEMLAEREREHETRTKAGKSASASALELCNGATRQPRQTTTRESLPLAWRPPRFQSFGALEKWILQAQRGPSAPTTGHKSTP